MITPASIGDWAMVGGLLGILTSFAALAYRSILVETEAEAEASVRSLPARASTTNARRQLRLIEQLSPLGRAGHPIGPPPEPLSASSRTARKPSPAA